MRYLVTGASGFIGCELTRRLVEAHGAAAVTAAIGPSPSAVERRHCELLASLGVRPVTIDLGRADVFGGAPPKTFDVLFHLAAYATPEHESAAVRVNDLGTENLLRGLGPRLHGVRVVYTGTIASELPPGVVDAGAARPRTAYGQTKLRGEIVVRDAAQRWGASYTVARLPTVYGRSARSGGMFGVLPPLLRRGSWLGRIDWPGRIGLVHVADTADLLIAAAHCAAAAGRTFLVNSGEDPSFGEIAACIAAALGVAWKPVTLSPAVRGALRRLFGAWWLWGRTPHPLMIALWRASFLIDGLTWDGSQITQLIGQRYRPWRAALTEMYGDDTTQTAVSSL